MKPQEVPEGAATLRSPGRPSYGVAPSGTPSTGSAAPSPTPVDALAPPTPRSGPSLRGSRGGQGTTSDVFDIYCSECFGPFASWRTLHGRNLCDTCATVVPVLCEACSVRLAAIILDGYKVCGRCANEGRTP